MNDDGPPTSLLSREARRAAERQAAEDQAAAAKVRTMPKHPDFPVGTEEEEQAAINNEFSKLAGHPAFEAEQHEVAAYLNMQAGAIANQRTGRHILFSFPKDMTVLELFEAIGWMATDFRKEIQRRHESSEATAPPPTKLHIARAMPQEPPVQ